MTLRSNREKRKAILGIDYFCVPMEMSKLEKFEALNSMPNVLQNFDFQQPHIRNHKGEFLDLKGRWAASFFDNNHPTILELACGKGEYTVGLAEMFPQKNYIGFDLKGNRLWSGAKIALDRGMKNVAFFRTKIELIDRFFSKNEIDGIWITFPDPFLNETKSNRRLTAPYFLEKYRQVCKKDALINLKTDSEELYMFTKKIVAEHNLSLLVDNSDVYKNGRPEGPLGIKTYYERMHLEEGRTIRYLQFKLN